MNTALQYAEALHMAVVEQPERAKEYRANLYILLQRRKHEKLLPRIVAAYEKRMLQEERSEVYKNPAPEAERTRILLELYRTLIHS